MLRSATAWPGVHLIGWVVCGKSFCKPVYTLNWASNKHNHSVYCTKGFTDTEVHRSRVCLCCLLTHLRIYQLRDYVASDCRITANVTGIHTQGCRCARSLRKITTVRIMTPAQDVLHNNSKESSSLLRRVAMSFGTQFGRFERS